MSAAVNCTTRRFPRTSVEAWPREHADPITFFPRRRSQAARACVLLLACVALGFLTAWSF